jgi:hypothetical protein
MSKDKNEILKSLENNIPSEMKNNMELRPLKKEPTQDRLISDAEEDFEIARKQIKSLIDTSGEAIEQMHNLAADAEHPRAFEVLGALIKQTAEMNGQLLDLQKQRKALIKDENKAASTTTNNSIFVGTTTELQNLLKGDDNADNIIEVD